MPEHTPPARRCPACDGFSAVAITIGGRDRRDHLRTIAVRCPACRGTGITTCPVLAQAGR
ncbi:hypothetical protein QCN29_13225 [Streptomyces sp. HNM0663]|uniref:Transcription factor zinc-finger domain-containing protein n=1 Tax=Streptomyces chengmaiensis TaxID=3040919 RepID=A0ABT6HNW8_9ACTN|nr:hypothetical protein [Streptomyces chengmaiensis]MDH2389739.1 hypothetical protein [Streptomyces chengmaiensis]